MKKTILLYGLALAALTALLKMLEYRMLIRDLSMEIYVTAIAILFTALGVWVGRKLIQNRANSTPNQSQNSNPEIRLTQTNPFPKDQLAATGISPREYEVLALMAKGHSNQEIADQLFVSLSTIKTHSANIFFKLDVKRRTQAIQKAKELEILA
ncbi:MAG: DNA-binding response regulator [Gemmatimonadaceae bacterium]|nr:DNA-binding response regulator [Chitinophagaceae bacterium]